ncbi:unnamed protein product [Gongylonema pulchrum]|uniref:Uncharacterized protein n=1 Tax=Gongylonema pulchrum TaxID=637853 RepID=A0A183D461_9BILA|nr:unnamed protein product [Gongylonema pulchrum]
MLDDDENGNPKTVLANGLERQQGTRWHEFKSGKTRYQLPFSRNWLHASANDDNKHSCDASSEDSDDLPTDVQASTICVAPSMPPFTVDPRHNSLKRRRRSRVSISERLPYPVDAIIKSSTTSAFGNVKIILIFENLVDKNSTATTE